MDELRRVADVLRRLLSDKSEEYTDRFLEWLSYVYLDPEDGLMTSNPAQQLIPVIENGWTTSELALAATMTVVFRQTPHDGYYIRPFYSLDGELQDRIDTIYMIDRFEVIEEDDLEAMDAPFIPERDQFEICSSFLHRKGFLANIAVDYGRKEDIVFMKCVSRKQEPVDRNPFEREELYRELYEAFLSFYEHLSYLIAHTQSSED